MSPANVLIQSTTIDLLQAIIARGEIDLPSLQNVQAAVIGKLYFSVHTRRLELQNKLLHLLHSVISVMTTSQDPSVPPINKGVTGVATDASVEPPAPDMPQDLPEFSVHPLLLQTLMDGINSPSNSAVLQHWLDFVLMAIPQFHHALQSLVSPLGDCICKNLRIRLDDLRRALTEDHDHHDFKSNTTDAEFIMLLNALERLVLLSLSTNDTGHIDEDDIPAEKPLGAEPGGLLGMVTSVFSSESTPTNLEEQLTVRCFQFSGSVLIR
jgi:hypothetical protein